MSPDIVESNLRAVWNETARTGRRQRGRQWYPAMRQWAADLAAETGHTVAQVVAVLSITSPGAQLATNMTWTENVMRGVIPRGKSTPEETGRFPNVNAPKIRAVLDDPVAAEQYVRGPKVSAFHRAILGDTEALVLDRWALFAATGERESRDTAPSPKLREAVDAGYRALARKLKINVRDLQATLWLQVRETTPRAGSGTVPRLADITA